MRLNLIPNPKSLSLMDGTVKTDNLQEAISAGMGKEAYSLQLTPEGISLTAGSEQGLIWGRNTLRQLRRQFPDGLPCMTVSDGPAYPLRAFHLDSARHMLPLSELKKMVDMAAYFKLNTLHWHISDDQGWRVECKAFPKLHEIGAYRKGDHFGTYSSDTPEGGYYTRQEVREFVSHCHSRGIQVIPEIDLPGHVTAILAAYPHLSCRGEAQEVCTRAAITTEILCAGREEVYAFLETLLLDMMELFPDPWFHIGGDEAPKVRWEHCPHCRRKLEAEGLSNLRQLQGYLSNRIADFLRQHGRRAIMWNDGAYGGNIHPDVVLQVWFPDQDGALQAHGAKGGQLILSPVDICYCDYPYGEHPQSGIHNMEMAISGVNRDAVIGGETLLWSEFIRTPERMQELAWPRLTALAEACWCGENRGSYEDFCGRLEVLFPVFEEMGIHATAREGWDPGPEEAAVQSKAFRDQFEAESENQDYELLLSQM